MGKRYSVPTKPQTGKMRRCTLQLPPHLQGIGQLCNLLDLTLPLVLYRVVVACVKSSEFRDFVAPYLVLISKRCYPLERFLPEPETPETQQLHHDFESFCEEFDADRSRMLILMMQFFLREKSVKTVSNGTCRTLRMNHTTHQSLNKFAAQLGISNAEVLRDMVAFAHEYPEDRFNLQALVYASRYNVSVPSKTYDGIKNLATALDAGINDTASGLIDFCLANPNFLDSVQGLLEIPEPAMPMEPIPAQQYEQIGLF